MKKITILSLTLLACLSLSGCKQESSENANNNGDTKIVAKPLSYKKEKQMVMKPLDKLGRAVDSHIQVSKNQLPKTERASRLTYNPSGWHNYKLKNAKGKYYWAYNRGHLVGYQFCGLNDEPRNLITETVSLNTGSKGGMDANNPKGQLYYEQKLRQYIDSHPNERLDYQVTPLYKGNELMPRSVRLSFVAYDSKGKQKKIKLSTTNKYIKYKGKLGQVILPNTEKGLKINYQSGESKIR